MASPLNIAQQKTKDMLIADGCKVVERTWGHLVIMPTIGMAIDWFASALKQSSGDERVTNENYALQKSQLSLVGEDRFIAQFKAIGNFISPEYEEKYRKQFAHLKDASRRDKLLWVIEDAIRNGDPRKIDQVNRLVEPLVDLIYEINPSLKLDVQRERTENGPVWDAGLIGSEDPRPCWEDRTSQRIKRGSGGDGAYRIIINTDTAFGAHDHTNCMALCAMITVLQQYADVEVWVQQGWVASHFHNPSGMTNDSGCGMNGITLFPAFRGSGLHPAQLMFWCGHPMRDSIFSYFINRSIGRESSGTSETAELDCDLYTANGIFSTMPYFPSKAELSEGEKHKALKALAAWTSTQLSGILLDEQDLTELQTT